jgi:hypothetical protein
MGKGLGSSEAVVLTLIEVVMAPEAYAVRMDAAAKPRTD